MPTMFSSKKNNKVIKKNIIIEVDLTTIFDEINFLNSFHDMVEDHMITNFGVILTTPSGRTPTIAEVLIWIGDLNAFISNDEYHFCHPNIKELLEKIVKQHIWYNNVYPHVQTRIEVVLKRLNKMSTQKISGDMM